MKKYNTYKDSGIEWIGEIPEHWEVKRLKYRCSVKARVGWKGLKSDEFLQKGYAYLVTGSDFRNDNVNWKDCYYIDKERYDEDPYIQLEEEDLLITKDGTIGKLAIIKNLDKPACLNSGIFVVKSLNKDFLMIFLFWILKSKVFNDFNDYTTYGSTIKHLYQNVFIDFSFPFPDINTQIAISSYLDKKTTEIDELIADKEALLKLYEEEKAAVINDLVTGKKVWNGHAWTEPVEVKDGGIEWLGEIPKHWEVKKLKAIAKVQTGRTPKIQKSSIDFFKNGEINWFTPSDFYENNELIESKRKLISKAIESGEVELFPEFSIYLVSIGATLGKVSFFKKKASANQQINVIIFNERYNPQFGYYFLVGNKEMVTLEADYTTLPILNQSKTKSLIFAVPPLDEQKTIVNYIESETNRLDTKIENTKKLIDLLKEYRTALISEVVTGKVKVV